MKLEAAYAATGNTEFRFFDEIFGELVESTTPLYVNGHVRGLSGDRLAVMVALLLGPICGTNWDVGRAVSRRVATAVQEYLGYPYLSFKRVEDVAHTDSFGVDLAVAGADNEVGIMAIPDRRGLVLDECDAHNVSGSILANDRLVVGTNSWVYRRTRPVAGLAVPVLFAQQMSASRIVASREVAPQLDREERGQVERLLDATGLIIEWPEVGATD